MQRVPAQAPTLQRAGLEVLDQHVGLARQCAHDGLAFLAAQVELHRALVARLHLPPHGGPVAQHAPLAKRVADAHRLDLDDVGAELGQGLAGKGPGDQLTQFDDLDALQCFHAEPDVACVGAL